MFSTMRLLAQTADFTVPANGCMEEQLVLTNNSSETTTYEWDFCTGGFDIDPVVEDLGTVSGLSNAYGVDVFEEAGEWYVMMGSFGNDRLIKVKFDGDLMSTEFDVTNLGNVSSSLDGPAGLSAIKVDGIWNLYIGSLISNYGVSRIEFPTGPDNPPSGSYLGMLEATGNTVRFSVPRIQNDVLMLVNMDFSDEQVVVVEYGDGIDDPYTNTYSSGTIANLNNSVSIAFVNDSIAYVTSLGNEHITKLNFSDDLRVAPTMEDSYYLGTSDVNDPFATSFIYDGSDVYGIVANLNIDAAVLNMGDLSSTPGILSLSGVPVLNAVKFVKFEGQNVLIGVGKDNHLYRITFEQDCGASVGYSTDEDPDPVVYSSDGTNEIALNAYDSDGQAYITTNTVTIANATAPAIDFTVSDNECITESNLFTPIDGGGLTYAWDFDNNGSTESTATSPTHTFGSTGDHIVNLTVDDGTCSNFVTDTLTIYPEPITPTFFTSGAPYCTGADIAFTNLFDESDYNGATLTYEWDYNGEGTSSERNGAFNFDTEGIKTVTLTASIPGCATPSAEPNLDLVAGPAVAFSTENECLGDETLFTNSTVGDNITSQIWDFGDTETSNSYSPSHSYATAGEYEVTLTVSNSGGCNNVLTQPLTINDKPVTDFNMGVGCEGQSVVFEDLTTVNDANIESYTWDFAGQGSSTDQDPSFTFDTEGTYTITLTTESTYGCMDEHSQNLSVQVAPTADFDINLGCLNASTQFLDQSETESENPIISWYWDINGDIKPNTQNPTEVFGTPGVYTATLTVTPNNLCVSTISKDVTIYDLPIADFSIDNNCDNENTLFQDASSSTVSIEQHSWQFDEQGMANGNPATFHFQQSGEYDVSLTITDEIGCKSTSEQTITINPSPTAAFDVNRDIGPAPLTINFTNQTTSATSYLWQFGDSGNSTSSDANTQFSYTALGDYYPELISTNEFGCNDTSTMLITVAEPILDLQLVQISQEEVNDKTNLSLTVRNNGNVAIHGFDIRIDLENNTSIFESYAGTLFKNQSVTFPLNFTLASADNNIGYMCITVDDLIDTYEDSDLLNNEGCLDFNQEWVVENSYPNPVSSKDSKIRINMILPAKAPIQLFLLDAAGSVLHEEVYMDTNTGLNSFFLDIYAYDQGIYFIKVVYNQIEHTQRFAKI